MLSISESAQFRAVKKFVGKCNKRYDFWLIYADDGCCISFEGGFELQLIESFRNDFSLLPNGTIRVNYSTK